MKVYDAAGIRNLAIVGHGGCGKTSLVSALLFDAGAVNRLGRVDDGTATTDFDPDEIERKISLQLALAHCEWRKTKLNLLDAPGYANFLSEARSALRVADAALLTIDAVSGVEVQTEKVWGYAAEQGLPRLIAVNRMDRERASFERSLDALARAFGRAVVPLALVFETRRVEWTGEFVVALLWLALVLSVATVGLLMWLIRRGAAAKVASLFYLTPAVAALMAWAFFGERFDALGLVGMALTVAGVALANR